MKMVGQLQAPAASPRITEFGTDGTGSCQGPRAGTDVVAKIKVPPCRESNPGCTVRRTVASVPELSRFPE
jgi:hypothetical protein